MLKTVGRPRDQAIFRLLIDIGGRLGEIAGMMMDDMDFDAGFGNVLGKGRRGRRLQFGPATALDVG